MGYREQNLTKAQSELMERIADRACMSLDLIAHNYMDVGLSRDHICRAIENAVEALEYDLHTEPTNN